MNNIRDNSGAAPGSGVVMPPAWPHAIDPETDHVHDASLDSFPASDPPSWAALRVGPPGPESGLCP